MRSIGLAMLGMLVGVATACGGDDGSRADAGPITACSSAGTYSQAFPSEEDAAFCMFPWDTAKPELVLTECGDVFERCSDDGPTPDFSCLGMPVNEPATPDAVTLTGFVDVFSSGPDADSARIQVFRASQLEGITDITAVNPIASTDVELTAETLVAARACPKERDLTQPRFAQGQCNVPEDGCASCSKSLDAVSFCAAANECEDLQRWEVRYEIANVPTNEFLVLRTVGLDGAGEPQVLGNTWAPLIQYNVYLSTGDDACVDEDDTDCIDTAAAPPLYRSDANLLSSQDYQTIPTSAGLSAGVTPGNGAIAGEIHDCNGTRVRHAQVGFGIGRDPRVLVYFNGNPVKTLPRLQQINEGTNSLGLYSGLDISPGPIDVVGVGVMGGALAETNRFASQIWADSVTLVRLGGGRPDQ